MWNHASWFLPVCLSSEVRFSVSVIIVSTSPSVIWVHEFLLFGFIKDPESNALIKLECIKNEMTIDFYSIFHFIYVFKFIVLSRSTDYTWHWFINLNLQMICTISFCIPGYWPVRTFDKSFFLSKAPPL